LLISFFKNLSKNPALELPKSTQRTKHREHERVRWSKRGVC